MMKGMLRRALAGVAAAALAAAGLAGLAGTANAAPDDSSTITITGDVFGEGRTFTAYLLATYKNAQPGTGDCASSVELVQNTTGWNPTIAEAAKTAMGTIPSQYNDNEVSYVAAKATGEQLRDFAKALAEGTDKPQGTTGTLDNGQVTIDVDQDGWYLVVDTAGAPLLVSTKIAKQDGMYGCLADATHALGTAAAKPKSVPTPTKKVIDANGNEVDSVSALVGSQVEFKVTSKVPNHTSYDEYDWKIVDTPRAGLVIDQSTVTVTVNGQAIASPTQYTAIVKDGVLTVDFVDVAEFTVNDPIVIDYKATVTKDAIITTDQNGATNKVIAKHDDTSSGEGTVTVKSYGFTFTKTDVDGTTIQSGAKFTVQQNDENGRYLTPSDTSTEDGWTYADDEYKFEGADGVFSFQGLPAGTYYVAETDVPDGYMQDVKAKFTVTINADGSVTVSEGISPLDLVTDPETDPATGLTAKFEVKNVPSVDKLPLTGAAGTMLFTVLGLLIAGAGVTVYMKSRSVKHALRG